MGAEGKEHPRVPGGLRESFTEEQMLELRLEQSVGLQSARGWEESKLEAWRRGRRWNVIDQILKISEALILCWHT